MCAFLWFPLACTTGSFFFSHVIFMASSLPALGGGIKQRKEFDCNTESVSVTSQSSKLQVMGSPKGGATVTTQIMFNFLGVTKKALAYNPWIHHYRLRVFNKEADHRHISVSECGQDGWTCLFVLRNPLDRVVSSYLTTVGAPWIRKSVQRGNQNFTAHTSFAEFVTLLEHVAETGSRYVGDDHYLPQCNADYERLDNSDSMMFVLLESLDAGLAWFGESKNIQGLTRGNMSSRHYRTKSTRVEHGAAYLPYDSFLAKPRRLVDAVLSKSLPSYDSFLAEPGILRDVCCLFRKDIVLYRKACSAEWLQGCAECVDSCAKELQRLARCGDL